MFLEVKTVQITPGAMRALQAAGTFGTEFVVRHQQGDWGDIEEPDRLQNEWGVEGAAVSILSVFSLPRTGQVLWVITAPDRSYTILMLPEEY